MPVSGMAFPMIRECSFRECGRPHYAKSLCRTHYHQALLGKELSAIRTRRASPGDRRCGIAGCEAVHYSRSWCERHYKQLNTYGLTPDALNGFLERQGGLCAICGATEPRGRGNWIVDHDHACCRGRRSCGACVRGLLCSSCNSGLGMFQDDIRIMNAAIYYLCARTKMTKES